MAWCARRTDRGGTLTAVWARQAGGMAAATRPAGGHAWRSPQLIGDRSRPQLDLPQLAVAANGAAILVWQRGTLPGRAAPVVVEASYRRPGATTFGPVTTLATSRWAIRGTVVAIDRGGVATAAWRRDVGGRFQAETATRVPTSARWTGVQTLTGRRASATHLALSVAPNGRALVASATRARVTV
ncbi:MAG: hypothetical protein HYX33_00980 [Actinobacteria bacterium]|nr:hypothetical protein [Actinomycetota bacterium]